MVKKVLEWSLLYARTPWGLIGVLAVVDVNAGVADRVLQASTPRIRASDLGRWAYNSVELLFVIALLVLLAPLLLTIAAAIRLHDGGPALFSHPRIGKDGRMFACLKFRSMAVDADTRLAQLLASDPQARQEWEVDHKLRKDPRVTKLGAFLRTSSLDELPQLLNVLKGQMALVGPRPIVHAEAAKYGRRFPDYCRVKPGITGLWQVSGRNDTSYRRRVAIDTFYARNRSAGMDVVILAATVPAVLLRRGSY